MSETEGSGFDQVAVPDGDGRVRVYTHAEFDELPLADRVRLLMNGKAQFFRNGQVISPRAALGGG